MNFGYRTLLEHSLAARHLPAQRRVIAALAGVVRENLWRDLVRSHVPVPELPGPELREQVAPPAQRLIRDYLRHVGADPRAYEATLPPHLFPQWSMPLAARSTRCLGYRFLRAVNGGCRLTLHAPLARDQPLDIRARVVGVKDDGRRAVVHQHIVTGQGACATALEADIFVIVPSARPARDRTPSERRPEGRATVAKGAQELARFRLSANAGLAFALLTGDVNPVHWLGPYARAAGFDGPILHGFATLARVFELLQRAVFAAASEHLKVIDVRFTRPLHLPAEVGVYLSGDEFGVGGAPGEPAYLTGSFQRAQRT